MAMNQVNTRFDFCYLLGKMPEHEGEFILTKTNDSFEWTKKPDGMKLVGLIESFQRSCPIVNVRIFGFIDDTLVYHYGSYTGWQSHTSLIWKEKEGLVKAIFGNDREDDDFDVDMVHLLEDVNPLKENDKIFEEAKNYFAGGRIIIEDSLELINI
jgi:hypothetical protein